MSENYSKVLEELKSKIEIIVAKYEEVRAEKDDLLSTLDKYKTDLNHSNNKIKELENKIDKLQLIDAFKVSTGDVKEARHIIRKIIKDIDKCIGQIVTE